MTDAATASRTLLLDLRSRPGRRRRARRSAWRRAPAADRRLRGVVGETDAFGARSRSAGWRSTSSRRCSRSRVSRPGRRSAPTAPAPSSSPTPAAAAPFGFGLAACVAWRLRGERPIAWTARSTARDRRSTGSPASACSAMPRSSTGPRPRIGTSCSCPGWRVSARRSGRPPLAAPGSACRSPASRGDLLRALVWGIAAQIAALAEAIAGLRGPLRRLRADGGLTRSARLMQAQADLLGVPVECYPSPDATALGVAALARLGAGGASTPRRPSGAGHRRPCTSRAWGRRTPMSASSAGGRRRSRWRSSMAEQTSGAPRRHHDVVIVGAGVVGSAIARELRSSTCAWRCWRPARRRRRHQQGEHGSAAHGLRLQAGNARGGPGAPRSRAAERIRPRRRNPARARRRAARGVERAGQAASPPSSARTRQRLRGDRRGPARGALPPESPHLGAGAQAALEVPDEGIVCAFTTPLAFATEALLGGCELRLGCRAGSVERLPGGGFELATSKGRLRPASWSTPPACSATSSTACSAMTASPSSRAAAS